MATQTTNEEIAPDHKYPGYTEEAHPELFDRRAMLPQPSELKPGQLPASQIKEYFENGYTVVEKFFTEAELEPVRACVNGVVDDLAQKLYKAGKIPELYAEYGFLERLTKVEAAFPGACIICSKLGAVPQALKDLWANERLLNVIEQLIGPDIAGNPAWNLRTKVPNNSVTTVPWHQDVSYLDNDTYRMLIPTVWIPFVDSTAENGCLEVMDKGHRTGKVATHQCCYGDTFYTILEEAEMERTLGVNMERDRRTLPVKSGGFILFNNVILTGACRTCPRHIRWSLDLRWQRASDPAGLWELKNGVVMRKGSDPHFKVDWTEFDSVNRPLYADGVCEGRQGGPDGRGIRHDDPRTVDEKMGHRTHEQTRSINRSRRRWSPSRATPRDRHVAAHSA
ncbi:uncharacterized protein LOC127871318 isoform X2 [Dreissena polymorpha]|uniref:uncharacterized protein LOC127871318 isoform X2 n=1 Tax=Dreissena polymorpha TaxID=45954 RepID=UPI002263CFC2|nr:uncharacterized protein LOC127871318 isoform X2 [Dreissena polymorpha]